RRSRRRRGTAAGSGTAPCAVAPPVRAVHGRACGAASGPRLDQRLNVPRPFPARQQTASGPVPHMILLEILPPFGLPLPDLPGEELAKRSLRVAHPLGKVLRQRQQQFEGGLRFLLAQLLEGAALEDREHDIVRGQGREDVLARREERQVAERVSGGDLAERGPAFPRLELEGAAGDEHEAVGPLASAKREGAAADRTLLAGSGEDADADVAELAQDRGGPQRDEQIAHLSTRCSRARWT